MTPTPGDRRRLLLHATPADTPDAGFLADWQQSAEQMWDRYTDAELSVILDFPTTPPHKPRNRTESVEVDEP